MMITEAGNRESKDALHLILIFYIISKQDGEKVNSIVKNGLG